MTEPGRSARPLQINPKPAEEPGRRGRCPTLVKRSRLGEHVGVALGWTIALVAGLAVAFTVLNRKARGSNYDRFRRHRSRRKYRMPISEVENEPADDEGTS